MKVVEETITPEKAEKLMKKNISNRHLSPKTVNKYVREIKNGKWLLTSDTIKISKSGNLIDGQHRLQAAINAKMPITTLVAYDVPDNAFEVIDTGKKRSLGDVLSIVGYGSSNAFASAIRLKYALDSCLEPAPVGSMRQKATNVSNADIVELAEKYSDLEEAIQIVKKFPYVIKLTTPAAATVAFHEFIRIDKGMAHYFFEKLESGADLSNANVLLHLRNKLMELRNTPGISRVASQSALAALFQGWNYLIEGNPPHNKFVFFAEQLRKPVKPKK